MSATNGALALGLVAVLAGVALVVRPPAPPGIAEFAPQVSKPISKAPMGQGTSAGDDVGSCGGSLPCGAPTPTATPVASRVPYAAGTGAPSALQCYTWPDGSVTQTFDPQSPPCVATWLEESAGNGGATTSGVSATEIRVAVPAAYPAMEKVGKAYERFFNGHFQLYGRKLRLVFSKAAGDAPGTPQGQRAAASAMMSLRPFAALQLNGFIASDPRPYENRLIDGRVIALRVDTLERPQAQDTAYFWTVNPQMDAVERNLGAFLCGSLPPGKPASYAGGAERAKPRRFGILQPIYDDGRASPPVDALVEALSACGDEPVVTQVPYEPYNPTAPKTGYQSSLLRMRNDGVTSLVVFDGASWSQLTDPMSAATSIGYQPEWVEPGLTYFSSSSNMSFAPKEQLDHLLGITSESRTLPRAYDPSVTAYQEVWRGQDPGDIASASGARSMYVQLQLIASGVQASGPRLTVNRFSEGLQQLEYPNPGAGSPPTFQSTVGFERDRTLVDDYAVWFWTSARRDREAPSGYPPGTRCFAELGRRWRLSTWPRSPIHLFPSNPQC